MVTPDQFTNCSPKPNGFVYRSLVTGEDGPSGPPRKAPPAPALEMTPPKRARRTEADRRRTAQQKASRRRNRKTKR